MGWRHRVGIVAAALLAAGVAAGYTHEHSRVQWEEYSGAAFQRAREEGKPVFLVVSAVWCFNCQLYESQTLEVREVAEFLNRHTVPVFVDYDRRSDLARAYPAVGIPVTVVFAPDGERLVSVPGAIPADRLLANLRRTLRFLREEYRPEPARPGPRGARPASPPTVPDRAALEGYRRRFEDAMERGFDPAFGGFGLAQKEPHAEVLRRLLDRMARGDDRWREPVRTTLRHILGLEQQRPPPEARPALERLLALQLRQTELLSETDALQELHPLAGLFDPVEGGFFRYATRRNWTVPHFEKTLFANAELIDLFLDAHRVFGEAAYRDAARRSALYVIRTLFDPEAGRFLGSQRADEVYYHLGADERPRATPPPVDPTTYAASSARAALALLRGAEALQDPSLREVALRGLAFVERRMLGPEGVLSFFDPEQDRAALDGQLADNAWVARAFLGAHGATGEARYLARARELLELLATRLYDPAGGGFFARRSTQRDLYRPGEEVSVEKPFEENGVAAATLLEAFERTGEAKYRRMAQRTLGRFLPEIEAGRQPASSPEFDRVAQKLLEELR
ncbi:MAG: hypothetical protein Kow0092_37760 [Deferrisomatales bacterium]